MSELAPLDALKIAERLGREVAEDQAKVLARTLRFLRAREALSGAVDQALATAEEALRDLLPFGEALAKDVIVPALRDLAKDAVLAFVKDKLGIDEHGKR